MAGSVFRYNSVTMDDISVKKRDIEGKLNQEKGILVFLKDSLEKSSQLTGNMLEILAKFESRIHKLEDTIVPVHQETEDLQRRQGNIVMSLSALDHVISYHHVYSNVEHIIRDAPTGQLDDYIKNLETVLDAIEFFNQNNQNCLELTHLATLREYGCNSLEKEFHNQLKRHSKPVCATTILELVGTEEEPPKEDVQVEHLPEKVMEDLSTISDWLMGPGKSEATDFISVYAQIRSKALSRSLQGLKDVTVQGPGGLSSSNSSISGIYKAGAGSSTPTRKGTVKKRELRRVPSKQDGYNRRASALITVETGIVKEEEVDIDAPGYILSCKALLKLLQSERELMKPIIPEDHQIVVFEQLIQDSLNVVIAEGEAIIHVVKRHVNKHNYFAVLQVLPILTKSRLLEAEFDVTLEEACKKIRSRFPDLIHAQELTVAKSLGEFADGIKHGPDKHSNMPSDGTVHELTRNTLLLMEQLLQYVDTLGNVLTTHQADQANIVLPRDPRSLIKVSAEFVQRVLGVLGLNLELKARWYEAPTLSALFLLNNYHYILKALQRSGLLSLLLDGGITVIEKQYQDLIREHKDMYQKCWSKVVHCLQEMEKPVALSSRPGEQHQKLKEKQRQNIKDKFKNFNTEFEEICQVQKTYSVPDDQMRDQLRKENVQLVVPLHKNFMEKYQNVPFTKNPEKYMKYTVEQVEKMMHTFFDVSA